MPETPWPYPAFASRSWLGGASSGDPALVAAIRAVRGLLAEQGGQPGTGSAALLAGLRSAAELGERLDWAMLSLVGEARCQGASWSQVGAALGVSKQAAHARFADLVAQALARAKPGP